MNLHLTDKVALIARGSSRGSALRVQSLAAEGARVCICARGAKNARRGGGRDGPAGRRAGDRVIAVAADVGGGGRQCRHRSHGRRFGGIDILVNNVGLGRGGTLLETTDEEWQEAIDQTLYPPIRARASPCRTCERAAAA